MLEIKTVTLQKEQPSEQNLENKHHGNSNT